MLTVTYRAHSGIFNDACTQVYIGVSAGADMIITIVMQHPLSLRKKNETINRCPSLIEFSSSCLCVYIT